METATLFKAGSTVRVTREHYSDMYTRNGGRLVVQNEVRANDRRQDMTVVAAFDANDRYRGHMGIYTSWLEES